MTGGRTVDIDEHWDGVDDLFGRRTRLIALSLVSNVLGAPSPRLLAKRIGAAFRCWWMLHKRLRNAGLPCVPVIIAASP